MKPQPSLYQPSPVTAFVRAVVAVASTAACLTVATLAEARSEAVTSAPSGVTYVSGGVATEAVELLKSMEKDFNLKAVFADRAGEYLSDVKVTITDSRGRVLLDVITEGPLLMAKLPVGSYRIDATFDGRPKRQNVAVTASKLKRVAFQWPSR